MAGSQRNTNQGKAEAEDLPRSHGRAKEQEVGDEDDHRYACLLDCDIDCGRVVESAVKCHIEKCKAKGTQSGQ
jgi:hypothetical protein